MIGEVNWESVESEVRSLVDARIETGEDRIEIRNPTDEEVEQLFEYTNSSELVRGYPVPSEEKLVLKSSDESNEPYKQEQGVSVDEYGCLEVESELHTSNLVASLSQGYTETSIYTTGERAIAVTDGGGSGATVYDLSKTPIEAVVEYYWQFDRWTLDYQDSRLDLRDESEVKNDA
ncbi:uncharacterized protein Nmlp_1270 [Natronomonas moolapensis 8.8.11]|uniref:Uncharacterized protein n=1 Tax=Natronomonas moolapensis (strain DSM 18674 / CECT 7526 / JCM 14361 / 8.8.11) TaxID=268739 RepID=M1XNH3_NATM8|nr:hypothetical protein [Natronomonas moolapensis]CCQ35479.1 uncharacterized protein Nmlp_1270 [Natronomonas moolapensis 8.8.11]